MNKIVFIKTCVGKAPLVICSNCLQTFVDNSTDSHCDLCKCESDIDMYYSVEDLLNIALQNHTQNHENHATTKNHTARNSE